MYGSHSHLRVNAIDIVMKKLLQSTLNHELEMTNMLELLPLLVNNISEHEALNQKTGADQANSNSEKMSSNDKQTRRPRKKRYMFKSLSIIVRLNLDPDEDPVMFLKLLYETIKEIRKYKSKDGSSLLLKDIDDWRAKVKRQIQIQEELFAYHSSRVIHTDREELIDYLADIERPEQARESFETFRGVNKFKDNSLENQQIQKAQFNDDIMYLLREIGY